MRDVLGELVAWWRAGETVGVATMVAATGSTPRGPGATMLVGPAARAVGSISGGCLEAAVFELAAQARDGAEPVLCHYGGHPQDPFAPGLTCGGVVQVFVDAISRRSFPALGDVEVEVAAGRSVAVALVVEGSGSVGRRLVVHDNGVIGSLGGCGLDTTVSADAQNLMRRGRTGMMWYGLDGDRGGQAVAVFVQTLARRPRMILFGATDHAEAVSRVGSLLGYHVTICDARSVFATDARFPCADEVVVDWPHRYLAGTATDERTVVCVLTHDPRFDVPVLAEALRRPLAFVGALGSHRTAEDRMVQLGALGFTKQQLARLHSPVGLDIGGRTPEETAVSVAAEIVAARHGHSAAPLSATQGPIHRVQNPGPVATCLTGNHEAPVR